MSKEDLKPDKTLQKFCSSMKSEKYHTLQDMFVYSRPGTRYRITVEEAVSMEPLIAGITRLDREQAKGVDIDERDYENFIQTLIEAIKPNLSKYSMEMLIAELQKEVTK